MLAFAAPGPRFTRQTPTRPVSFASVTAMNAAEPSCRAGTTSISGVS
jgi:hypothetical protein